MDIDIHTLISTRLYTRTTGLNVSKMLYRAILFSVLRSTRLGATSIPDTVDAIFKIAMMIDEGRAAVELYRPIFYMVLPDITKACASKILNDLNIPTTEDLVEAVYDCLTAINSNGAESLTYELLAKLGLVDEDVTMFTNMGFADLSLDG